MLVIGKKIQYKKPSSANSKAFF